MVQYQVTALQKDGTVFLRVTGMDEATALMVAKEELENGAIMVIIIPPNEE